MTTGQQEKKEERIAAVVMSVWILMIITVICFGIFKVFPNEIRVLEINARLEKILILFFSFLWGGNIGFFVYAVFWILKTAWRNCL